MKKVLATLLAVLLLMCVFGTVALAAGNMELGHWYSIKYHELDFFHVNPQKGTEHNNKTITLNVSESDQLFQSYGWNKKSWLNYVKKNYSAKQQSNQDGVVFQ